MISSWKRLKAALRAAKKQEEITEMELTIPSHFRCPISLDLMKDPVTLSTGITYNREDIETWIEAGNVTCPVTKEVLKNLEPIPNHTIRKIIQDWCVENRTYGVERIPTPRIPITSHEVSEILSELEAARKTSNYKYCLELVLKIKALAKESARNRGRIVANGAGRALSATFEDFSRRDFVHEHVFLFEEILSTLSMTLSSLDEEGWRSLSKIQSLEVLVWFLRFGNLSSQKSAALVLKGTLLWDQEKVEALVKIEGVFEALVKVIKEPICPTTTKASLAIIYLVLSPPESLSNKKVFIRRFLELGLAKILLEVLVDSDRGTCEKGLGVLDRICSHDEGRKMACENALIIPLLVKKLLRISNLSTEFSISILWKLAKCDENGQESVILEALEVGAFQKMLLLLQVGCQESTKQKVTELLKLMNLNKTSAECIDSSDFKNLKRPY